MKIALCQINPTVGDVGGNSEKIVHFARRAAEKGADLAVFPEMSVTGYPPLDLLDNPSFIRAATTAIHWIARHTPHGLGMLIGAPVENPSDGGKKLQNAAILLENGLEAGRIVKTLLPTYDVFDERRYFEPAERPRVLEFRGQRLGISVCEDMWNVEGFAEYQIYARDPLADLAHEGADIFINISASPFSMGKHELRTDLIQAICRQFRLPFVLVNQVGANTEILFDGDSGVFDRDGKRLVSAPSFEEALVVWDTGNVTPVEDTGRPAVAYLHDALVTGIRDYVGKTGVFRKVLVGLSGGIDSAVTCALAVAALGTEKVVGVTLPSEISSSGSVADSEALAQNLGIEFHKIPIKEAVDAFGAMLESVFRETRPGVAEENIQARARGVTLMAMANKFDYLLLTTGNKSELSMGYATLYGDMSGGLAVLSDVFKTDVYRLAGFINETAGTELIPESTMTKSPSAELAPGQRDEDTLPPYPILDEILMRYIELLQDMDTIVSSTGFDEDLVRGVLSAVDRNEYKRRQAAPGLRISGKAFGIGRRIPIVMKYDRRRIGELREEASPQSLS